MKITYLLTTADSAAGTERAVIWQANRAALRGDIVTILSVYKTSARPAYDIDDEVAVEYAVDISGLDLSRGVGAAAQREFGPSVLIRTQWDDQFCSATDRELSRILQASQSDLVVTTTPALTALAARLLPPDVVIVAEEHRATMARSEQSFQPLEIYGPEVDCVVSLTQRSTAWLTDYYGDRAPLLETIPNAVPSIFSPQTSLTEKRVVGAGRFVAGKNFEGLIRAFATTRDACPDWSLRIYGHGPRRNKMQKVARDLGIESSVEIVPPAADLASEWTKASIFALSSRAEGLPLVALEAAAAGLPLVAYDCLTGPSDIIDDGVNGFLIPPGNTTAFGAALQRLMLSQDLRESMSLETERIREKFSEERIDALWSDLFAHLMTARGRGLDRLERAAERAKSAVEPEVLREEGPVGGDAGAAAKPTVLALAELAPQRQAQRTFKLVAELLAGNAVPHAWVPSEDAVRQHFAVPGELRTKVFETLASLDDPSVQIYPLVGNSLLSDTPWVPTKNSLPSIHFDDVSALRVVRVEIDSTGSVEPRFAECDIEFWEDDENGRLTPLRRNDVLDLVERSAFDFLVTREVDGVEVPTFPLATRRPWRSPSFPIDVVYTWVDDSDVEWQRQRQAARAQHGSELHGESDSEARYKNRDELKYSLRSINAFAPWVNRIYVVTSGQRPDWYREGDDKLVFVDHKDIFSDANDLPTFNSHAIESQLHHIEGLSEHFLYFNDDTMLRTFQKPENYFYSNGMAKFFPSPTKINDLESDVPPHLAAAQRNREILEKDFDMTITQGLLHTPYPQLRSVLQECESRYSDVWRQTSKARFRGEGDISTLSSFAPYYAFATGRAVPAGLRVHFIGLGSPDLGQRMNALVRGRPDVFALGEPAGGVSDPEAVDFAVLNLLEEVLPIPSPWEKLQN